MEENVSGCFFSEHSVYGTLYKHKTIATGWLDLVILQPHGETEHYMFFKIVELHIIIAGLPGLVLILTSLFCSRNSSYKVLLLFIIKILHATICLRCNIEISIGNFDHD